MNSLILVVDDDPVTTLTIQSILSRSGFQVCTAMNVADAYLEIHRHRPGLVLLDVNLPDGNGFDVCRKILEGSTSSQMPVIFLSADDDVSTKVLGFEAGGVDYITKPVSGEELTARVKTHLRLRHAYETLEELQSERIRRLAAAQESILPDPSLLPNANCHVSLRQLTEGVGGDFYDVIVSGEGTFDYIIADASGHDLASSYWTSALKTLLLDYANPTNSPLEILNSLNGPLRRILPAGSFFTMIYARINRRSRTLRIASAGHPPAVMLSEDGSVQPLYIEGDVLGVYADAVFGVKELKVHSGEKLFLYTDGLTESFSFGDKGLYRLLTSIGDSHGVKLERMLETIVAAMASDRKIADDIVLMGIEV